jgi:predicted dithiol-disulfide oxidoreductase (DUF899 family)
MSRYTPAQAASEYATLRDELSEAEMALREQREAVAALRRRLPGNTVVESDPVFLEGPADLGAGDSPLREVRLSELLAESDRTVVLMHFMFGKAQEEPCPMCTLWADGYDGIVPHLQQRVNFAVLVAGDVGVFRAYARERGWRHLRILSAGDSTLKGDLSFEDEQGRQFPGVSLFTRGEDGAIQHFYSGGAVTDDGGFRGMDLLSPFWSFLDLTPEGRGDFMPRKAYD